MSSTAKMLGLLSFGQQIADQMLLRRFLSGIATLLILLVITGIIAGALLLGGIYGVYLLMLHQGVEPMNAALITAALTFVVGLLLVAYTINHGKRTVNVSKIISHIETGFAAKVMPIADAFIDGLLTRPAERD